MPLSSYPNAYLIGHDDGDLNLLLSAVLPLIDPSNIANDAAVIFAALGCVVIFERN
jgi:hypothetical protein